MERLKDAVKVILILGISIVVITFLYKWEGKAHTPTKDEQQAPVDTVPAFFSQGPEEGLYDALLYYDIQHPDIVYAQALLETGYFKSKGCTRDNNLFGLYDSKTRRYCIFNYWTESVEAYKNWIQYRYKPPNDYYEFLRRIHYASDPRYITKLKQIVKKHGKVKQNAGASHNQQTRQGV